MLIHKDFFTGEPSEVIHYGDWSDEIWNWKVKYSVQVPDCVPFPRKYTVNLPSGVDAYLDELYVDVEELEKTIAYLQEQLEEIKSESHSL